MRPPTGFRKVNVLAVDDTPANLVALDAVLGSECNLLRANSGAEAIAVLQSRADVDVVLMDVQMPTMDGFEAASRIRQLPDREDVPIIFITAFYKEDAFIRKGYEAGAVDYFSKPFDPEILKRKVAIYGSFRQKAEVLRERERQIRDSEELLKAGRKLSTVLESLRVGVIISDGDGRICQTNEVVSRLLKDVEPTARDAYGEILGWWDANGRLLRDEHGPLNRALKGEASHNETLNIRCVDGTTRTVLASASPLHGLTGQIVGAVIVIQDVTESKKIEADLELRINRLISVGVELEQSARG